MNMPASQVIFLASVAYEVFILACEYFFKTHKAKTAFQIKARILLELILILHDNTNSVTVCETSFKGNDTLCCEINMLKQFKSWGDGMCIQGLDGET